MKFDALLLVDCWGEDWIKKGNGLHVRQFYGRVIDYAEMFSFVKVLFASGYEKTHVWFENQYPNHHYVRTMDDVKNILPKYSNILIGGAAWNFCLHKSKVSIQTLVKGGFHLYCHPELVDTGMYSNKRVTHDDFKNDIMPWRKVYDFYYLQAGVMRNYEATKTAPVSNSV